MTKLMVPQLAPDIVARRGVQDVVRQAMAGRVTLVCAPAGYGKTTLLTEIARRAGCSCAWYTLDRSDAVPRFLLHGLGRALASGVPAVAAAVQRRLASWPFHSARWRVAADTLINALASAGTAPVLLILDDYQVIDDTPGSAVVAYLSERLPPGCHLAIASRCEPRFPLARLRAIGAVCDISWFELALQPADVGVLLRRQSMVDPSAQVVADVMEATEGWPLGVQLLLRARQGPATEAPTSGLTWPAIEFFETEVLRQVPAMVRTFLLRSSLLERFSLDLMVAGDLVTHDEGAQALAYLRGHHLFLVACDAAATWYRYHALFRASLRRIVHEQEGRAGVARLHRACAQGCAAVGETMQAIDQYLAAGDREQAATLLEEAGLQLLHAGALSSVARWLERLPAVLPAHPSLELLRGWVCFYQGETAAAIRHLRGAASDSRRLGQAVLPLMAALCTLGRHEEALRAGCYALQHLATEDPRRDECAAVAATVLDRLLRFGEAGLLYRQAGASRHDDVRAFAAVLEAAFHLLPRGRLSEAIARAEKGCAILEAYDPRDRLCYCYHYLASIYLAAGRLDAAAATARRGVEVAAQPGREPAGAIAQITLARVALARGDYTEAGACLRAAEELSAGGTLPLEPYWWHAVRCRLAAHTGDHTRAGAELEQALALVRRCGFLPEIVATILELMPDLPADAPESPWTLLDNALAAARQVPSPHLEARVLLHMAARYAQTGLLGDASTHLQAARTVCEQQGYSHYLRDREPLLSVALHTWRPTTTAPIEPNHLALLAGAHRGRDQRPTTGARPHGLVLLPGGAAHAADGACESGLSIRTFGCFALLRRGQPVETNAWGRRKVREIFLYLVTKHLLEPGQPVSRDELIETFWPDLALHTAQSSLSAALSRLRRVLEPELPTGQKSRFIQHRAGSYMLCLGPTDQLDAALFLHAAQAALAQGREPDLVSAVQRYGGPYLPEQRYAGWTTAARELLQGLYVAALEALAECRAACGDWSGAIGWAQRVLLAEPGHEASHRRLITYYAQSGQHDQAVRQYRLCCAELVRTVGAAPSPATTAVYRQVCAARSALAVDGAASR